MPRLSKRQIHSKIAAALGVAARKRTATGTLLLEPYVCEDCGFSTTQRAQRASHTKFHRRDDAAKRVQRMHMAAQANRAAARVAREAAGAPPGAPKRPRPSPEEEDAAVLERLRVDARRRAVRPPWVVAAEAEEAARARARAVRAEELANEQRRAAARAAAAAVLEKKEKRRLARRAYYVKRRIGVLAGLRRAAASRGGHAASAAKAAAERAAEERAAAEQRAAARARRAQARAAAGGAGGELEVDGAAALLALLGSGTRAAGGSE